MRYVIQNANAPGLYWANKYGWVTLPDADRYNEDGRENLRIPIEGEWTTEPRPGSIAEMLARIENNCCMVDSDFDEYLEIPRETWDQLCATITQSIKE